jgi:4-amino-4-deoxy-L-arabinose transferase-like glycosyltransferase
MVGGPILFGILLLLVVALQGSSGFFSTELARHPDEPGHFVTGVLVYDYMRSGFTQAPLAFAEQFYEQYPKVAFGHWPPMFYALQAIWYAAFGAQPYSLILLLGAVTALTAALLFWRTTQRHGAVIGSVTTGLFLATPVVQFTTLIVLSDSLVTLFSFVAVLAFIDFMRLGRSRSLAAFAIWALLGLLTKGTAIPLAFFALVAPALAGRTAVFRSRALWVTGAIVGALIVPWYVGSLQLGQHGAVSDLVRNSASPSARLFVLGQFANLMSPAVFAGAVLGAGGLVRRRWRSVGADDRRGRLPCAVADHGRTAISAAGSHCGAPVIRGRTPHAS